MSKIKILKTKSVSEDTKIKYAIDFIEELSWLVDSKKNLKLSEIPTLLRAKLDSQERASGSTDKYVSPNPNIHYLIGTLPRLFQDTKLFSSNEEIADFAKEVLKINITRVEKRSKYELIGLIVCETDMLDDKKLDNLVKSLGIITGSREKIKTLANEKSTIGFSWNETIRKLTN